jgi:peptide/nickel transport system substrate-binding protein
VPYSNGSGYDNPQADHLLQAAQTEIDPKKRQQLYWDFQKLEMTDLPNLAIVYIKWFSIYNKSVMGLNTTALGPYENFSSVYIQH